MFHIKKSDSEFDLREKFNLFSQNIKTMKNGPVFTANHLETEVVRRSPQDLPMFPSADNFLAVTHIVMAF